MSSAVIFGGAGTFGRHVARELVGLGIDVTIAGRDLSKAEAFACSLQPAQRALAADVAQPESCRAALASHGVAVNCAGPFRGFGPALLDTCLEAGCHYADITDDRSYAALIRSRDERLRQSGLAAVYGCSSLPGLSGALGITALAGTSSLPERARVTLLIGNANPKGLAAIRSLVESFGRPILAPQGTLKCFRDREVVPLPAPFGRRAVYNFESPEYDLFPSLLGVRSVVVKVGFELRSATHALAALAALPFDLGSRSAHLLQVLAGPFQGIGSSGGVVQTELFFRDGSVRRASLWGSSGAQCMAALPCALVVRELCRQGPRSGALTAYDFLGAEALLSEIVAKGFRLERSKID